MNINLSKLEREPRDEEKYQRAKSLYEKYGNNIFKCDMLRYSGELYKLPYINKAGSLTDNAYIMLDGDNITLYTINGYIQPVCVLNKDLAVTEIIMDSLPLGYLRPVIEYLKN